MADLAGDKPVIGNGRGDAQGNIRLTFDQVKDAFGNDEFKGSSGVFIDEICDNLTDVPNHVVIEGRYTDGRIGATLLRNGLGL